MLSGYFFTTFASDPFYNMAMDEWLFARAIEEPDSVFVRLYSWSKGAITIGLNQDFKRAVNSARLNGTPVIRRVTGGRALYHDTGELTYSIAATANGNNSVTLGRTIQETSRLISTALSGFLEDIGISTQIVRQSSARFREKSGFNKMSCFESTARNEIIGGGRKIVGSAQRRINDTFLQHGSIKLATFSEHPALSKEPECDSEPYENQWLKGRTLDEISGVFSRNMAETLAIPLLCKTLCEKEEQSLEALRKIVVNNSLHKRNLIKHLGAVKSL